MSLITVRLVKCFLQLKPATFELDLHQRQTVYEDCYVVAILVRAFSRNLLRDLELVLAPIRGVEKFNVRARAIIPLEVHLVTQDRRPIKNGSAIKMIENFLKLTVA